MAKKLDDYSPYLFMAGIVAIVGIVAFVLTGSLSGAPVYENKVEDYQELCTDNDPDNDYYKLGKTTHGRVEYLDYCLGDTHVVQFRCATTQDVSPTAPYECPNGCYKGYCLREPIS
jgi:hypothetical protein